MPVALHVGVRRARVCGVKSSLVLAGMLALGPAVWTEAQTDERPPVEPATEERTTGERATGGRAVGERAAGEREDPYVLGYEAEPAMDAAGRTIASIDRAIGAGLDKVTHAERHSWLRPLWEVPLTIPLTLVDHEGFGHGGRARELGLKARYGVTSDGAYTEIDETPRTLDDIGLISGAGVEADGILARRLLLDAVRPGGAAGASVPLYLIAKLDFPLYVLTTVEPKPAPPGPSGANDGGESFVSQYTSGNDMAGYLVARQAMRRGESPQLVWEGNYQVDFGEARIGADWRDLRTTAVWAAADPAFATLLYAYVTQHIRGRATDVQPPTIPLGRGFGLSVSTRAALAPTYLTRFLDLLVTTPAGVVSVYVRDLDSHVDRGFGVGVGFERFALTRRLTLGVSGDFWREPDSSEGGSRQDCWNVTTAADVRFTRRAGLSLTAGAKSRGYFPGRPSSEGFYLGLGALVYF